MLNLTITDVRAVPGDSAFLIDDGKTAILFDSGFAFTGYAVAEKIKELLGDRPVDYILLTHSHYDHCLGSVYVKKVYPGAKTIAHAYTREVFGRATARNTMRQLDRLVAEKYDIQNYEDLIDELQVDTIVQDGDTVHCGDMHFQVVGLPGHTKCSIGFYLAGDKLLLGTETLGVYFEKNTYLPSYLVGYKQTLDAFQKVKQLDIQRILLPHYGVVEKEEADAYLSNSENISHEIAQIIKDQITAGKSHDEIFALLTAVLYKDNVSPTYPYEAFHLNTDLMIELIRKELVEPQQ